MVGCDGHNECSAQATPSGAGKHALALARLRLIAGAAGWRDDSLPGTVTPPCRSPRRAKPALRTAYPSPTVSRTDSTAGHPPDGGGPFCGERIAPAGMTPATPSGVPDEPSGAYGGRCGGPAPSDMRQSAAAGGRD